MALALKRELEWYLDLPMQFCFVLNTRYPNQKSTQPQQGTALEGLGMFKGSKYSSQILLSQRVLKRMFLNSFQYGSKYRGSYYWYLRALGRSAPPWHLADQEPSLALRGVLFQQLLGTTTATRPYRALTDPELGPNQEVYGLIVRPGTSQSTAIKGGMAGMASTMFDGTRVSSAFSQAWLNCRGVTSKRR